MASSALVASWKVTYDVIADRDQQSGSSLSRDLMLWKNGWISLMNLKGSVVEGRFLGTGKTINIVDTIVFSLHDARILRGVSRTPEVRSLSLDRVMPVNSDGLDLKKWKITYSTLKDLDRGRIKAYDGSLTLWLKSKRLVLSNAKGAQIGCRSLLMGDNFCLGAKLKFPAHIVRMGGSWIFQPRAVEVSDPADPSITDLVTSISEQSSPQQSSGLSRNNVPEPPRGDLSTVNPDDYVSPVLTAINLKLDFSHGRNFAKDVRAMFGCNVHPTSSAGHFIMVVSFGRATFKMEEDTISIALEAVLGGHCGDFKVPHINNRVFSFCVASKVVGFHILRLRNFSCKQFKCSFHLWGRGGPNWIRKFWY
jgi:hypothetical protein